MSDLTPEEIAAGWQRTGSSWAAAAVKVWDGAAWVDAHS